MPWFPIIPDQVAAVEAELGVSLPTAYKALVGDPRNRQLLAHPTVGAIDLSMSMHEFAAHTAHRRATLPGFPAKAVVAMEGPGRYIRFWLPDPARPDTLGGTVYAWDTVEGKRSKDASGLAILKSMFSLVMSEAAATPPRASTPPFRVEPVELSATVDGWIPCGTWELRGRYLTVTDLGELPSRQTPSTVQLAPGPYRVEVQLAGDVARDDAIIAAWRIVRHDTDPEAPIVAERVAQVEVDLGAIAVYDRQEFMARVRPAQRDAFASALLEVQLSLGRLRVGEASPALVVRSGKGDGSYPLVTLRSAGEVVGAAVFFLDDALPERR